MCVRVCTYVRVCVLCICVCVCVCLHVCVYVLCVCTIRTNMTTVLQSWASYTINMVQLVGWVMDRKNMGKCPRTSNPQTVHVKDPRFKVWWLAYFNSETTDFSLTQGSQNPDNFLVGQLPCFPITCTQSWKCCKHYIIYHFLDLPWSVRGQSRYKTKLIR